MLNYHALEDGEGCWTQCEIDEGQPTDCSDPLYLQLPPWHSGKVWQHQLPVIGPPPVVKPPVIQPPAH